jgi:hypothetical protein
VRADDTAEPRFGMLESIRDFAAERLAAAGEAPALRVRHAGYFRALGERMDAALRAGEPEEGPVAVLAADIGNLRAAVEFGLESGDAEVVRQITVALHMYWEVHGLFTEARSWLDRALALTDVQDVTRRRLLSAQASVARLQGDYLAAQAASDEAASLAMGLAGKTELFESLRAKASASRSKEDLRTAEALLTEALGVALAARNGVGTSACRRGLAGMANQQGRHDEADDLLAENLPFVRGLGQIRCEGFTLASMADTSIRRGRLSDCAAPALLGATRALQIGDKYLASWCLDLFAAAGDQRRAAAILAAVDVAWHAMGIEPDPDDQARRQQVMKLLDQHGPDFALGHAEGQGTGPAPGWRSARTPSRARRVAGPAARQGGPARTRTTDAGRCRPGPSPTPPRRPTRPASRSPGHAGGPARRSCPRPRRRAGPGRGSNPRARRPRAGRARHTHPAVRAARPLRAP